jgi:hypothetical protein
MDASEELKQELFYLLHDISPQFLTIMQPFVIVRPHASIQRMVQDLAVLPYRLNQLVVTAAVAYPNFRRELAQDFGEAVRVLYYGLRAAKTRVMAGTGGKQDRTPAARYVEVVRRGAFCALTGLTADDGVKYQLAHIIPWSVGRWHNGQQFSFFRMITKLFGDHVGIYVWERSGGRSVNHMDNLMTLSPDIHGMYDSGVLRLEPTPVSNGSMGFTVGFARTPNPWFWTIVNGGGCVPLYDGFILDNNPAGCGSPELHWIVNRLEWLAQGFRFESGQHRGRNDLQGLWRANFV